MKTALHFPIVATVTLLVLCEGATVHKGHALRLRQQATSSCNADNVNAPCRSECFATDGPMAQSGTGLPQWFIPCGAAQFCSSMLYTFCIGTQNIECPSPTHRPGMTKTLPWKVIEPAITSEGQIKRQTKITKK